MFMNGIVMIEEHMKNLRWQLERLRMIYGRRYSAYGAQVRDEILKEMHMCERAIEDGFVFVDTVEIVFYRGKNGKLIDTCTEYGYVMTSDNADIICSGIY